MSALGDDRIPHAERSRHVVGWSPARGAGSGRRHDRESALGVAR
jgi:hypothetical protein